MSSSVLDSLPKLIDTIPETVGEREPLYGAASSAQNPQHNPLSAFRLASALLSSESFDPIGIDSVCLSVSSTDERRAEKQTG